MTDVHSSGAVAGAVARLVVVKVGGRVQSDPSLPAVLADAWAARHTPGTCGTALCPRSVSAVARGTLGINVARPRLPSLK